MRWIVGGKAAQRSAASPSQMGRRKRSRSVRFANWFYGTALYAEGLPLLVRLSYLGRHWVVTLY